MLVNQNGTLNATNYYYPYGGNRGGTQSSLTTKRFTGQYHESGLSGSEGLYYYNARWFDAQLGRFAQADTIVPNPSNPQSLNRYMYVAGNPLRYRDPSGHRLCEDIDCNKTHPAPPKKSPPSNGGGGGGNDTQKDGLSEFSTVVVFSGSYVNDITIEGPLPLEQMPAWDWNPWRSDMIYVQYPGTKYGQYQDALNIDIEGETFLVGYSAGAESSIMYALSRIENGQDVPYLLLIGPTFSGADISDAPPGYDIGAEGWYAYLDIIVSNGTSVTVVDDSRHNYSPGDIAADEYSLPDSARGSYQVVDAPFKHYVNGFPWWGMNNNPYAVFWSYGCAVSPILCSFP